MRRALRRPISPRCSPRVADLYEPLAEERGQRLTLANRQTAVVDADGELLFEAVGNLVDNAIKFTRRAARSLSSSTAPAPLVRRRSATTVPGSQRATGRGAAALLPRAQPGACPASGLGLSIVAAIAHLHRAELSSTMPAPGSSSTAVRRARAEVKLI